MTDANKAGIKARIENEFTYHAPKGDQTDRYVRIRDKGKELALEILECTPICDDQHAAIRKVREAVMTANAAIACTEVPGRHGVLRGRSRIGEALEGDMQSQRSQEAAEQPQRRMEKMMNDHILERDRSREE